MTDQPGYGGQGGAYVADGSGEPSVSAILGHRSYRFPKILFKMVVGVRYPRSEAPSVSEILDSRRIRCPKSSIGGAFGVMEFSIGDAFDGRNIGSEARSVAEIIETGVQCLRVYLALTHLWLVLYFFSSFINFSRCRITCPRCMWPPEWGTSTSRSACSRTELTWRRRTTLSTPLSGERLITDTRRW